MISAAERGKIRINQLRDDLIGDLRIASTPELCANHIIPALSHWMSAHRGLAVHLEADNQYIDLIDGRIDIALRMSAHIDEQNIYAVPLAHVDQVLVATPSFINQSALISRPQDLVNHDLLAMSIMKNYQQFAFQQVKTGEVANVEMKSRLSTNNILVAKSLCLQGHGIARVLYLDVQKDLMNGSLVEVLPEWKLPKFTLYAVMLKREQQPTKIHRCVDALKQYFSQLPGGRIYQDAS